MSELLTAAADTVPEGRSSAAAGADSGTDGGTDADSGTDGGTGGAAGPTSHAAVRPLWWRVLPGVAVLAVAAGVLVASEVGPRDVLAFGGYVALGLALPGTLLWRAAALPARWRVEELALGTALGYAVETLLRVAASAVGLSGWVVLWPVPVVLAALLVPGLRRRCLRGAAAPLPAVAAWSYAAIISGLVVWLAYSFFRTQGVTWADGAYPMGDLVFVLALAGDVGGHWPPQFPYVQGEPLQYHWFYAAHLAQARTVTGAELPVLLFRLALVPMIAVLVVTTGALADRIVSGLPGSAHRPPSWAAPAMVGPLAALLAWVVTEITLETLVETIRAAWMSSVGNLMGAILWWSPTQTFSTVLLVPAAVVTLELVRGRRVRPAGRWFVLIALVAACSGAKGSALPVLIAGAGMVVAAGLVWPSERRGRWTRRVNVPALGVLAISTAGYLLSSRFVYGGQSYGTEIDPFGMADISSLAQALSGQWLADPGLGRSVLITVLAVLTYHAPVLGWYALPRAATPRDPAVWLTGGAGLLGLATMVLLYHPGQSQLYFIRSALPLLAAGAAAAIMVGLARVSAARAAGVLGAAFVLGLAGCAVVAWRAGTQLLSRSGGLDVPGMVGPYLLTACVLTGCWAVLMILGRVRLAPGRQAVGALAVAAMLLAGAGAVRVVGEIVDAGRLATTGQEIVPDVPAGAELRAARWLRDNSAVDEVFITNVQCIDKGDPLGERTCSNLGFWVSAYAERRAVVNGWGYTATNARRAAARPIRSYVHDVQFWDETRLRRSLEFIAAPTALEATALRADYQARWVFADSDYGPVSPALAKVATERFRDGPVTIYELT